MKKVLCLIFTLVAFVAVSASPRNEAADSTTIKSRFKYGLELGAYYQVTNKQITLPTMVGIPREGQPIIQRNWWLNDKNATDNPFWHGAAYATLHCQYNIVGNSFYALGSLTGELRGVTYGVFNRQTLLLFPQIRVCYHDSCTIRNRKFKVEAELGNFNNISLAERLTLYNVDVQGGSLKLSYGHLGFEYFHTAILFGKIQQSHADAIQHFFTYRTNPNQETRYWKIAIGYCYPWDTYSELPEHGDANITAVYIDDNGLRIYGQVGRRSNALNNGTLKYAGVIGIKKEATFGRVTLRGRAELRYYGVGYAIQNRNYLDINYRDIASSGFPNTVGSTLYPLRNYDRPYSQASVFMEPQYRNYNIGGATMYVDAHIRLIQSLYALLNIDWNRITEWDAVTVGPATSAHYVYFFYKTGLYWKTAKDIQFFIGLTNKAMNLDNTYQTFYEYKSPCLQLQITKTVKGFL